MQINRVILSNYGIYRGHNVLDLAPRIKDKKHLPIILFGGKNGAGKTTLIDAIRLGLYGKISLGTRISHRVYEEYLQGMIHSSKDLMVQSDSAKIGIEFDFVFRGVKDTYYIERNWSNNGNDKVYESFEIRRKANPYAKSQEQGVYEDRDWPLLHDIQSDHWETFIADLVPERLSQLFFFDGEKIKKIAEDLTSTSAIEGAINSLLGLDLIKRMQADLNIYRSKEIKKFGSVEETKKIITLETEYNKIEQRKAELLGEILPKKQKEIDEIFSENNKIETRLKEEGSVFALQLESKKERKVILEQKIEQLEKQIRSLCESSFPLSLAPKWSEKLLTQLLIEKEIKEYEIVGSKLRIVRNQLLKELDKQKLINKKIVNAIEKVIPKKVPIPSNLKDDEIIHGLSEKDHSSIYYKFELAKSQSNEMYNLTKNIEQATRELQEVEKDLHRAPDRETLRPLFDKYQQITKKLAEREAEKNIFEQELRSIENELENHKREITQIENKILEQKSAQERFKVIEKVEKASDAYLEKVKEIKLNSLRHAVTTYFNTLAHKQDFVQEISIDPKNFQITLHNNGRAIPREKLSAGEKQILAISILWGLARTSGRPLPVIIDTPLGRLDIEHRLKLITDYFPNASHQVILLSTDTEVDKQLFDELKPNISHCFHLCYDASSGYTSAKEGYFWGED